MSVQSNNIHEHDRSSGPPRTAMSLTEPVDGASLPAPPGWHDEAIADLRRLHQASSRLRSVLEQNEALYAETLERLRTGVDVGPSLTGTDVAAAREAVVEALVDFDRARHAARGTFIWGQHLVGMNMKQIGQAWGISRQLAHRYFREAQRPS